MVATMMMSAESVSPGLLKMKVFLNIVHDIIISVNIVNSKTLSCESSYTVDMVMWQKVCNSSIPMTEIIITSFLKGFDFFETCSWFEFNILGLALGMVFKFYTSVAKGLKLELRKLSWGLIFTSVEGRGEKLVGDPYSEYG